MDNIFDKISQYNVINYIFPGAVFALLVKKIGTIDLIQENILIGIFFYYFIGLVISRIGSIIIEPLFKKLKIITYRNYPLYIRAAKKDFKIDTLIEVNNMYRTMVSLFLVICLQKGLTVMLSKLNINLEMFELIILIALFLLFVCSFRKQTVYVVNRIDHTNEQEEKGEKNV